jgi:hypothetical protein
MVKSNVVDMAEFIQDKKGVKFEKVFLDVIEEAGERVDLLNVYSENFKVFVNNVARDGQTRQQENN